MRPMRFFQALVNPTLDGESSVSKSPNQRSCSSFRRKQLPMTTTSMSVPMKHLKASSGLHTIGSSWTLKLVFTRIGQPVFLLK